MPSGPRPRLGQSRTFAALRHRNYRLWFIGQLVSMIGTWMQATAQGFLIYQLTQSPAYLGYVGFAAGCPSLLAALMIASRGQSTSKGRLLTLGSFVFPTGMLIFAGLRWVPLSLATLVGLGWGYLLLNNLANMTVQTYAPDALRGRVMSVYILVVFGAAPIGSLLTGALAELLGAPLTMAVCALAGLAAAGFVWLKVPLLRTVA